MNWLYMLQLFLLITVSNQASNYFGPIVHLFEWKFNDIANECETFLSSNGYGGVQVSPITECVIIENRPWYERYQPISYKVCSRSGDENSFKDMVKRCKQVGIKIYVDVVLNHMTGNHKDGKGVCGSTADTEKFDYPAVPYTKEDFNLPTCSIHDYNNPTETRVCELVGLHDLNTTSNHVRQNIIQFLNHLIDLGVAGFRIDAAKHMFPSDLQYIYSNLNNQKIEQNFPDQTKAFIYQEVIDFDAGRKFSKLYTPLALVTEFKYGQELKRAFRGGNPLKWFYNFGPDWDLLPSSDSLVFVDNHDNQRGEGHGTEALMHKESRAYKMAVAFMLSWPFGYPRVMSSFSFSDVNAGPPHNNDYSIKSAVIKDNTCNNGWVCEHRWRQIFNMVKFRKIVQDTVVTNWWDNGNNQISFCRGTKGFIAFNVDSSDLNFRLQTCLPGGSYCDIISGDVVGKHCSGKQVNVDKNGYADITIKTSDYDGVLAIHQKSKIN